jgi:hypothetical protein
MGLRYQSSLIHRVGSSSRVPVSILTRCGGCRSQRCIFQCRTAIPPLPTNVSVQRARIRASRDSLLTHMDQRLGQNRVPERQAWIRSLPSSAAFVDRPIPTQEWKPNQRFPLKRFGIFAFQQASAAPDSQPAPTHRPQAAPKSIFWRFFGVVSLLVAHALASLRVLPGLHVAIRGS